MNRTITFFVPGVPRPAGSKRAIPFRRKSGGLGVNVVDASGDKGKDWRASVQGFAVEAHEKKFGPVILWNGALHLHVSVRLARPRTHFGTGKNAAKLKPSAPAFHTQDPDATKLLRAIEDALTGVIWRDDNQVVFNAIGKAWASEAEPPGAQIKIVEVTGGDDVNQHRMG